MEGGLSYMKIELSSVDFFEENEMELDKKITFIFGKMERGNRQSQKNLNNDVSAFQGFNNIIDENRRLNAVLLSGENLIINA